MVFTNPTPTLQSNPVSLHPLLNAPEPGLNSGLFHGMRCVFYHYDPVKGTCINPLASSAVVTVSAGAGAVTGAWLFAKLPAAVSGGTSLLSRSVQNIETTVRQHPVIPVICGAVAGASMAAAGIYMLGSSLKPLTQEGIRIVRDQLVSQLQRDAANVSSYQEQIAQCKQQLYKLKSLLPEERTLMKIKAKAQYEKNMTRYHKRNNFVLGKLQGQMDVIVANYCNPHRLPSYEEAIGERVTATGFTAGRAVLNFINNGNYSRLAQLNLLQALQPVLAPDDLEKVKKTLLELPWKPSLVIPTGPIETTYNQINNESAIAFYKTGLLEAKISEIIERFPVLKPGPDGRIPIPDTGSFAPHLSE